MPGQVALAVVGLVALACCGVQAAWVDGPLVVGTLTADHGEKSPTAALLAFVFTFEDGPNAIGVEQLIVPERRATIVKQRRAYLAQMAAERKATGWSATFEIGSAMPGDRVETHSERATVVDSYHVRWTPRADVQLRMASTGPVVWFEWEPAVASRAAQGLNRLAALVGHDAAVVWSRRLRALYRSSGAEPVAQRITVSG